MDAEKHRKADSLANDIKRLENEHMELKQCVGENPKGNVHPSIWDQGGRRATVITLTSAQREQFTKMLVGFVEANLATARTAYEAL